MKTELKKLKVKFEGKLIEIDIQKELSINEQGKRKSLFRY